MCCKSRVLAWFVVMQPLFQSRRAQTQIPHGLHVHLTLSGVQLPKICLFCNNTKGCKRCNCEPAAAKEQMGSHRISKLCNCEPAAAKEQMTSHRISKLCNCEPAATKGQMMSHRISKLCNCEPAAAKKMTSHRVSKLCNCEPAAAILVQAFGSSPSPGPVAHSGHFIDGSWRRKLQTWTAPY